MVHRPTLPHNPWPARDINSHKPLQIQGLMRMYTSCKWSRMAERLFCLNQKLSEILKKPSQVWRTEDKSPMSIITLCPWTESCANTEARNFAKREAMNWINMPHNVSTLSESDILSVARLPFPASDRRPFLKSVLIQCQRTSSVQGTWIQSVVSKRHRSTWAPTPAGIYKDLCLFACGCWWWFPQWGGLCLQHIRSRHVFQTMSFHFKFCEHEINILRKHMGFVTTILQNQKLLLISISRTANLHHYNFHDASKRECFGHNGSFELNH